MNRILAVALLLAAAPVSADKAPAKEGSQLVCFTQPATGSHIKKRVCTTEKELAERKRQDQEAIARLKGGPTANKTAAGPLR